MKIVKQLAVFLANQPGALFRLTTDLTEKGINIKAISVTDTVDHAVVRLIVDKPLETLHLLGETGVLVVESNLLEMALDNTPGQLQQFTQKLMDAGINIEYAYGSTSGTNGYIYIRVENLEKTIGLFQ